MANRVRRLVTLALLGFLCHGTTTFFLGHITKTVSKLFSRNQQSGGNERAIVLRRSEEMEPQHLSLWKQLEPGTKVIFLGNPGTGKSTLLNSLIGRAKFRSGLSFGAGMTRKWEAFTTQNNVTFIDTPGLSDPELRKDAANNITEALQEGGKFKIIFVMTTRSGRVSSEDVTSMKVILDAVPTVSYNQYGIIFNRLGSFEYEELRRSKENYVDFLRPIWACLEKHTRFLTPLKEDQTLDPKKPHVKPFPDLEKLVMRLPTIEIEPYTVTDVESRTFQEVLEDFESLSNDPARMQEELYRKAPQLLLTYTDWNEKNSGKGHGEEGGYGWTWWRDKKGSSPGSGDGEGHSSDSGDGEGHSSDSGDGKGHSSDSGDGKGHSSDWDQGFDWEKWAMLALFALLGAWWAAAGFL